MSLWKDIWESQYRKCARCGNKVEFCDTAKESLSFEIICSGCYRDESNSVIIYDEYEGKVNE